MMHILLFHIVQQSNIRRYVSTFMYIEQRWPNSVYGWLCPLLTLSNSRTHPIKTAQIIQYKVGDSKNDHPYSAFFRIDN